LTYTPQVVKDLTNLATVVPPVLSPAAFLDLLGTLPRA
jgi:hypothetical protein